MGKYNRKLFWMGFGLNIIRKIPLVLIAAVFGIVGIWVKPCLYVALAIMLIVLIGSFIQQVNIKHTVEHSDDPNFAPFQEAMTSDNWQEELKRIVEDKIDKNQ